MKIGRRLSATSANYSIECQCNVKHAAPKYHFPVVLVFNYAGRSSFCFEIWSTHQSVDTLCVQYIVTQVCILRAINTDILTLICARTRFSSFSHGEKRQFNLYTLNRTQSPTEHNEEEKKIHSWMVMTLVNKVSTCYDPVYRTVAHVTSTVYLKHTSHFDFFFFFFHLEKSTTIKLMLKEEK